MDKQHATTTFDNASPPLKRHGKPHSTKNKVSQNNNEYVVTLQSPSVNPTLAMLNYTNEPHTVDTPPPPEITTFQASPPQLLLHPSLHLILI